MNAPFPVRPQVSSATPALVLGILSVVLCPLCGPIAWALGRKAEQEVDASGGGLDGRGLATAGKILGHDRHRLHRRAGRWVPCVLKTVFDLPVGVRPQ